MMELIKVGEQAPDFTLEDQQGKKVSLKDYKGKRVLIAWHPLAWTSVCTDQMRDLEREYERITEKGIEAVLALSVDAQPSKAVWAKALALENIKILADFEPKGEVSKAYGNYLEKMGASGRAVVVVDEGAKISYAKQYEPSELPDIEEIIENL